MEYPGFKAKARGRPHATRVGRAGSKVGWVVAVGMWAVLISTKVGELVTNIAGLGVREVHTGWVHRKGVANAKLILLLKARGEFVIVPALRVHEANGLLEWRALLGAALGHATEWSSKLDVGFWDLVVAGVEVVGAWVETAMAGVVAGVRAGSPASFIWTVAVEVSSVLASAGGELA
jgi:hypothetical protein